MAVTLRQLQHATLLARFGSFTLAAKKASLTQSAFSRSIDKLENQLGVMLFDRGPEGATLTTFGEALVRAANDIGQRVNDITQTIDDIRGLVSGHLDVALGVYPAEITVQHVLGEMAQQYPGLTLRAQVCNWEEVNQRVLAADVEIAYAVVNQAQADARLAVEDVVSHELAYYARSNHPLMGQGDVTPSDIDPYPLVSIRVPAALAPHVRGRASVDPATGFLIPAIEIDDFTVARGIIRSSEAIGIVAPRQIAAELASGEFALLRHPRPWIAPTYGFIQRRGVSTSTAAAAFKTLVTNAEKQALVENEALLDRYLPV